jgi:hypothetical protein
MAGRVDDSGTLPWPRVPRDLDEFKPEQWDGPEYGDPRPRPTSWNERRRRWYGARLAAARSLNRPVLPEHTGFAARPDWIDPRFPDVVGP